MFGFRRGGNTRNATNSCHLRIVSLTIHYGKQAFQRRFGNVNIFYENKHNVEIIDT